MKCPFCSSENTRVIDSRPADDNNSIRRRRLCDDCGKRFTTYEKVETIPLIIIKKDNNREQYDRAKIEAGVLRACHKRPISAAQMSPAAPCNHAPHAAASSGCNPCPKRLTMIPASTSPLPPTAIPGLPVGLQ